MSWIVSIGKPHVTLWSHAYRQLNHPGQWPIRKDPDGTYWVVTDQHRWDAPVRDSPGTIGPFDSLGLAIAAYFISGG